MLYFKRLKCWSGFLSEGRYAGSDVVATILTKIVSFASVRALAFFYCCQFIIISLRPRVVTEVPVTECNFGKKHLLLKFRILEFRVNNMLLLCRVKSYLIIYLS